MNELKIAAIVVNYNGLEDTRQCLFSLQRSTFPVDVIVVDNASKDNDAERLKKEFSNINVIESSINGGFSYGNNLGIKWAIERSYDYVLLINNDTVIDEKMVSLLVEDASDSIITVPSMFYYSKPDTLWYGGGFIDKRTGNAKHKRMMEMVDVDHLDSEICTFATGCCMLISVNIIRKIGMLEDIFFMYSEDVEFCIRVAENDIRIKYIPKAKLWHKVSASTGGSDSPFSTYYMTRNRLIYIDMHKKYFSRLAKCFTITTRRIRALMCKDKRVRDAFLRGISDYKKGIYGKVDI